MSHGGKRKGAGGGKPRKPESEKAVKFMISLSPDRLAMLDKIRGATPRSRAIAALIEERANQS